MGELRAGTPSAAGTSRGEPSLKTGCFTCTENAKDVGERALGHTQTHTAKGTEHPNVAISMKRIGEKERGGGGSVTVEGN